MSDSITSVKNYVTSLHINIFNHTAYRRIHSFIHDVKNINVFKGHRDQMEHFSKSTIHKKGSLTCQFYDAMRTNSFQFSMGTKIAGFFPHDKAKCSKLQNNIQLMILMLVSQKGSTQSFKKIFYGFTIGMFCKNRRFQNLDIGNKTRKLIYLGRNVN